MRIQDYQYQFSMHVSASYGARHIYQYSQRRLLEINQVCNLHILIFPNVVVIVLIYTPTAVHAELLLFSVYLCDPLLEGHVGVAPAAPHLVGALRNQVIHLPPQSLAGRTSSYNKIVG